MTINAPDCRREAREELAALLRKRAAYTPAWTAEEGDPGRAVLASYASMLSQLRERLSQAPDKNKLQFLADIGIDSLPPAAARAPVVLEPLGGNATAPAGSLVGATAADGRALTFRTEFGIGLTASPLTDVWSVVPQRDSVGAHAADVAGGRVVALFEGQTPITRLLFIGHDELLAIEGSSSVELEIELRQLAGSALDITWSTWDGTSWREFLADDVDDSTDGMKQRGTLRIATKCIKSQRTEVNGIETHWLRGELRTPLTPDPFRRLPIIDQLRIRTAVDTSAAGQPPDVMVAAGVERSPQEPVEPFGAQPNPTSIFYAAWDTLLARRQATVQLTFDVSRATPSKPDPVPPLLAWEYWAGSSWEPLVILSADNPNLVRATDLNLLSAAAGSFEAGTNDWSVHSNCTIARSTAQSSHGNASMAMTSVAAMQMMAVGPVARVEPGQAYTAVASFRAAPTARECRAGIRWIDASGATIAALGGASVTDNAASFKQATLTATAPANAAAARVITSVLDPAAAEVHFVDQVGLFRGTGTVWSAGGPATMTFEVPDDLEPTAVNGRTARWIRARLASGSYDSVVSVAVGGGTNPPSIEVRTAYPPTLQSIALSIQSQSRLERPEHVIASNGFAYDDGTTALQSRGGPGFEPFHDNPDETPSVYLGFDGELPAATLALYVDVEPVARETSHEFRWERWDGRAWVSLPVEDETAHLTKAGIIRVLWPGNRPLRRVEPVAASGVTATVLTARDASLFVPDEQVFLKESESGELALVAAISGRTISFARPLANAFQAAQLSEPDLPVFGAPRTWIRARLTEGEPPTVSLRRLLVNAVWASESAIIERELLGSGTNLPGQQFQSARSPILEGEELQVRELSGARARTDLAVLERELAATGRSGAIETDVDADGEVSGVWVAWESVTNLRSSAPSDRHYTVDRAHGLIRFGDGIRGRAAPTGQQNIRLRRYATGGGRGGNVRAGAITTPLSGIVAKRVWNPIAATGGADPEQGDRAAVRAPRILRHRYQAVSAADYRDLAIDASPEVFGAVAVRVPDDLGGGLDVLVLPWSDESPPTPSAQLLETVRRHLVRRCAVGAVDRLRVKSPTFVEVGVDVEVAPVSLDVAGQVFDRVRAAIIDFLHPVRGGPHRGGWGFGSTIHVARLAPPLEQVDGVDFVSSLVVTSRGAFVGDAITLATTELPSPGAIRVRLTSPGGT
ncbi:putative baseplate assembly protein [Nocardioides sp. GCM10028917]|uniref:putative baseplate assembly protein n=1 Tax=Nocardioides sp. GCM10028917 TaxID=3273408 RepID=UPI003605F5F0